MSKVEESQGLYNSIWNRSSCFWETRKDQKKFN